MRAPVIVKLQLMTTVVINNQWKCDKFHYVFISHCIRWLITGFLLEFLVKILINKVYVTLVTYITDICRLNEFILIMKKLLNLGWFQQIVDFSFQLDIIYISSTHVEWLVAKCLDYPVLLSDTSHVEVGSTKSNRKMWTSAYYLWRKKGG